MWWQLVVQNPIIHDNARSHTAASVMNLLRHWQWEILERPQYSPNMSPCDYNLFGKMKEPLQGTWYNTRLIHARRQSILNINKDGHADGVQWLPNIWQKVINNGGRGTTMKVHKCCTSVNKVMWAISNCCHYFSSNPCTYCCLEWEGSSNKIRNTVIRDELKVEGIVKNDIEGLDKR